MMLKLAIGAWATGHLLLILLGLGVSGATSAPTLYPCVPTAPAVVAMLEEKTAEEITDEEDQEAIGTGNNMPMPTSVPCRPLPTATLTKTPLPTRTPVPTTPPTRTPVPPPPLSEEEQQARAERAEQIRAEQERAAQARAEQAQAEKERKQREETERKQREEQARVERARD
jgi:hypothetical protein